jgi:RNA polymerase sigma factor (sigma-70 family)
VKAVRDDIELLDAWRAGEEAAGNELFDRHFDDLYGFFRGKARDGVDDLVQKTFLACVEGRDRLRGEATFRTYMFAAARRIFYRHLEHRRRDERVDLGVTSLHDLEPSPSQVAAGRAEQRLVREALRRIPVDYQVALELYYVQGFRGPELAEILDVPEATVRSRIRRGLEQLRARVTELASSPDVLESTVHRLEDWAASLAAVDRGEPSG